MILHNFLIILFLSFRVGALKIFVLYPTPSFSHQRAIIALTERLVKDGHELFVVSPNPVPGLEHNKNYTYVDVSFAYAYFTEEEGDGNIQFNKRLSKWDLIQIFENFPELNKKQFMSPQFLEFKRRVESEKIKFDLILVEAFFGPYACGFSRIFPGSAPIITMTTLNVDDDGEGSLGSINLPHVPYAFSEYTDKMSLWEKLENWYSGYYISSVFSNRMFEAAKGYFVETQGQGSEWLVEGCKKEVSLSLITSNSLYFYPRLLGPNVIETGPLHLKNPQKLPQKLQDWLDGAERGVIYFSLGSNMKSKCLPAEVRANFLKFFGQLPAGYRVLWKWELDGNIPGQTDNILSQKWLPQDSVLAHPKVKVFITQGGLQSFQEVVHYGVPTVGIPWFGDQECNVAKMVDAGIGVRLLPTELGSYQKIKSAIEAVLFDERYSKNMKKLSAISHDFTAQAMDKAVFWIEHIAKFGGAHLKPSTAETTLFEYLCLDILTVILIVALIVIYALISLVKFLYAILFSSQTKKIKKS